MNTYLLLKGLHILSATLLVGTGVGIAFFKWLAGRCADPHVMRFVNDRVVMADWLFTAPTVLLQPLTGFAMVSLAGYPMDSGWLRYSYLLYLVAIGCWLVVVWLQIRMRHMSRVSHIDNRPLPARYWAYRRCWGRSRSAHSLSYTV